MTRHRLPDWLQNLILPAMMLTILGGVAAATGLWVLWVGLAWGIVVALLAAGAIAAWLVKYGDEWGFLWGVIAMPAWIGLACGVIGGGVVRLFL